MVQRLLHFLDASPVNFLAARNIASELDKAGYRRFDPREALGEVKVGDKLYVMKNDSSDNAHAWHPNYSEKYDPTNHPILGGGPVIKFNAAQKYASDAVSAAVFAEICREAGVPCQRFVNHSDVAGGSTLGNILASSIPLRGADMGNAILAMHSCRETGSTADHIFTVKAFTQFFK